MKKIYLILILLIFSFTSIAKNNVDNYQRIFLPLYLDNGEFMIAIRLFDYNQQPTFLVVNPSSLKTQIIPVVKTKPRNYKKDKPGYFNFSNITKTRYYKLLTKENTSGGITHARSETKGNILTVDLCPSVRLFEKDFFEKLIQISEKNNKPTPVAIAISGLWLLEHNDDFNWLVSQNNNKKLDITWVNHSFSHIYYNDLPDGINFLTIPGTNIELEILETEKRLLEQGELPSIFFRFPGIITNKFLNDTIKKYGLIPLGTDAWIAIMKERKQKITPGDIILVHGNGNEPKGIQDLMPQLEQLEFVDLKQAI